MFDHTSRIQGVAHHIPTQLLFTAVGRREIENYFWSTKTNVANKENVLQSISIQR